MEEIKTLVNKIIRDANRSCNATDVQHSLMVDLYSIHNHATELLSLIELSEGQKASTGESNCTLCGVMRWHSFARQTPDNNKYIVVKYPDGRIRSYKWRYDFYVGNIQKGMKWKYI